MRRLEARPPACTARDATPAWPRRARGLEEKDRLRIVRELADEGNSIAKIAFMTRLTESMVREALSLLAPSAKATPYPSRPGRSGQYFSVTQRASRWAAAAPPLGGSNPAETCLRKKPGQAQGLATDR